MSKGKLLAVVVVWLVIFGAGAVAWKVLIQPNIDASQERQKEESIRQGSSNSRYDHRLTLALDSFSGYAVLRSETFAQRLAQKSIKITLEDDGAAYQDRLQALQSGRTEMAAFTIDALIKASAQLNDLPATIVALIDETRGADAIVGYKSKFASVDDFNDPNVRFVLTPDSASETLARVVMAQFDLPRMAAQPIDGVASAQAVYERYRASSQHESQVFVLWEPFVSKVLENPNMHTIISSRDLFGYIVDVLVVNRDFLAKNQDVVKDVVECYFRAAYEYRGQMPKLVMEDAKGIDPPLSQAQVDNLVSGIQWKDTQRNYAHFGITDSASIQHVEDMIDNITKVLLTTSAISQDPTGGRPNALYYDAILSQLEEEDFHPAGRTSVDGTVEFRALSDNEWETLTNVGTLRVPKLVFGRGTANLLASSRNTLDDLAETLKTSQYYVKIKGNATRAGDLELNKQLAADRAQAATDYLIERGIDPLRIRSVGAEPSEASSVTFMLGQLPY